MGLMALVIQVALKSLTTSFTVIIELSLKSELSAESIARCSQTIREGIPNVAS